MAFDYLIVGRYDTPLRSREFEAGYQWDFSYISVASCLQTMGR
jgi:hypothetical protein